MVKSIRCTQNKICLFTIEIGCGRDYRGCGGVNDVASGIYQGSHPKVPCLYHLIVRIETKAVRDSLQSV